MARLIDYNSVIGQIQKLHMDAFRRLDKVSSSAYQKAWDILMNAPTVDAVEVVRCKDCICSHPELVFHKYKSLNTWCAKLNRDMKLTGFCSEGKRRTNGC